MNRTISANELKALLATQQDLVLLDVRRRSDYEADVAKLPQAVWEDPEKIAQWSATISQDKDIVVYCVHGRSISNTVIDHLRQNNLRARYLEGGIESWKQGGGVTVNKE